MTGASVLASALHFSFQTTPRRREPSPPPAAASPELDHEDETPTPGRNPASRAAASSRVSPIQEQKTPVSSSEGQIRHGDSETLETAGGRAASVQETAHTGKR